MAGFCRHLTEMSSSAGNRFGWKGDVLPATIGWEEKGQASPMAAVSALWDFHSPAKVCFFGVWGGGGGKAGYRDVNKASL